MTHSHDRFGLDMLVELISAEQSQSPAGTPVERVEARLEASLALARKAGLVGLQLHLARTDFAWLCNARVIDRLSSAAALIKVGSVPVHRAKTGLDSHITGRFEDEREDGVIPFPLIGDPGEIPGFVQHVPTDTEKTEMLERLKVTGQIQLLERIGGGGTVH